MQADLSLPPPPAGGPTDAQRNARYSYLVGRLRNRQMTMEEATELFGLMQAMLRQSEAARQAMMRMTPPPPGPVPKERPAAPPAPVSSPSDDFFLLGILAMGAGAGLLAAMSRRLSDLTPPAPPPRRGRSDAGAATR
jgi:hypothetical protein